AVTNEIIRTFYTVDRLHLKSGAIYWSVGDSLVGLRAKKEIKIPGADLTIGEGKKISASAIAALKKANIEAIEVIDEALEGAFAAADIVDPSTGEVILEANEELTPRAISMAQEKNIDRIEVFFPERDDVGPIISTTLRKAATKTPQEAKHEPRHEDAARREDPAPARLLRGHQVPPEAAPQSGERGRHRSPRQP